MILPGNALKARLDALSIHTANSCGCKSLAKEANELGLQGCRNKRDYLAAKVKATATAMGYRHQSLDHFAAIVDAAIEDAESSLGPPVPINSLAVIACYFNPCHYAKPRENFKRFADGIRGAKLPLHAIELAFDDDEFETDAEFKVRGDSNRHKLWQKERLLNMVIQRVGHQYDALAWIDADVMLTRPSWANDAMKLLSRYPVIQLFRLAHDLHPDKRMTKHRPSMASVWPAPKARDPNATHPGFAWAGRSDWLLKYGLEDQMVVGGGDCTTMRALQADVGTGPALPFDRDMSPQWKAAYRRWAEPLAKEINGRIGFLDQSIVHLWHGTAKDRHYVDRWAYVQDYDPATDTYTDETGLIAWTDHAIEHKPDMVRKIADYFSLRNEDGPKPKGAPNHGQIPDGQVLVPEPPPLHLSPRSEKAIVTVAVGDEATANLAITRPYMEAYAARVGADLVVLDWPGHPQWTMSCKYAIPRAFDHYERIAWVDADVLLRPGCLNLFEQCEPDEYGFCDELWLHKRVHGHERVEQDYYNWRAKSGLPPLKIRWYLNGGVIVAPRSHRQILTASPQPMWPGFLVDQEWQMTQLLATGLPYKILDRKANWQWWSDRGFKEAPADAVLHFSGLTSGRTAEIARWATAYPLDADGWAIDARHREWIRRELMTGRHRRVLEIGSHRGYSTKAFLDALAAGAIDELHLCEPNPTPELLKLIEGTPAVLQRCTSLELLRRDCRWDLVLADGDHSVANVKVEAKLLLDAKVPALFAHDITADDRYPNCEGARLYRELFEGAGYHVIADVEKRPGERTDRGMMLATR
jgi:hypothetical protein